MTYYDQSQLAYDSDFNLRVTASVSNEARSVDPVHWSDTHRWQMAAAPGFADAYASAIAGNVPNPGRDGSVISDAQILAEVQAQLANDPVPVPQ